MRQIFQVIILLILLFTACKEDESIDYSPTPQIEFVSIVPQQVMEYQDSLVISISYIDGDGDLGENGNGIYNAFVKDLRNDVEYKYRIQQLAPNNANIIIQGTLDIVLDRLVLLQNAQQEDTSFEIYVIDRAGNRSNIITTSSVSIVSG